MLKYTSAALFVLLFASLAFAGKGGGKPGGGGGGGGGEEPPADPAIAYVENDALMVMDADGSNQTQILAAYAQDPHFSPDGSRIVFQGGNSFSTNALYVINVDGTGLTQLPKVAGGYAVQPAWSPKPAPDGDYKIAFKMFADVWLVNPDGTELQQLTASDNVAQGHPTWDPAASRLAVSFVQHDGAGTRLAEGIMLLDLAVGSPDPVQVSAETRVVEQSPPDAHATGFDQLEWARTQDVILYRVRDPYLSVRDGNASDIWAVDVSTPGSSVATLITGDDDATNIEPCWSPDDAEILFVRLTGRNKDKGLYVMNADGSGLSSLGVKEGAWPTWRR